MCRCYFFAFLVFQHARAVDPDIEEIWRQMDASSDQGSRLEPEEAVDGGSQGISTGEEVLESSAHEALARNTSPTSSDECLRVDTLPDQHPVAAGQEVSVNEDSADERRSGEGPAQAPTDPQSGSDDSSTSTVEDEPEVVLDAAYDVVKDMRLVPQLHPLETVPGLPSVTLSVQPMIPSPDVMDKTVSFPLFSRILSKAKITAGWWAGEEERRKVDLYKLKADEIKQAMTVAEGATDTLIGRGVIAEEGKALMTYTLLKLAEFKLSNTLNNIQLGMISAAQKATEEQALEGLMRGDEESRNTQDIVSGAEVEARQLEVAGGQGSTEADIAELVLDGEASPGQLYTAPPVRQRSGDLALDAQRQALTSVREAPEDLDEDDTDTLFLNEEQQRKLDAIRKKQESGKLSTVFGALNDREQTGASMEYPQFDASKAGMLHPLLQRNFMLTRYLSPEMLAAAQRWGAENVETGRADE